MRISVVLLAVMAACGSVSNSEPDGGAGHDATRADGATGDPDGARGDGPTADAAGPADARVPTQACTFQQAEHPGYTTIARDVALCGNQYTLDTIATACASDWHVCRVSEWTARYPIRTYRTAPEQPDLVGPTIGLLTSWGDDQTVRCVGSLWEANRPTDTMAWTGNVCHVPDDAGENTIGADYNPWNNGKFLFADDGTTVLQGLDANGNANWGSWDVTFGTTSQTEGFAVYCCAR